MQHNTGNTVASAKTYSRKDTSLNRDIIRWAMNAPYLEREEEYQLASRWKGDQDQDALHKIASAHMRLVIAIASKFKTYNLPMADLVQEGYVGLLEAASRFEPERDVRFSTYATWWIRASIQDYILRNWSIVRGGTSSAQKALFFNLRRLRTMLAQENEDMTRTEIYSRISSKLGVSVNDVETMDFRLVASDNSLSAPVGQDDNSTATRGDFLVDNRPLQDEIVESEIDSERRSQWLARALKVLNERELHIIRTRRLNDDGETLEALGEQLGISKERVRQIESRAMEKLRQELLSYNDAGAYEG
ncbi:MAG: RNA polymerase sigma factor [Candidatus Tokpelaia hoelldobleri]|uniref:RNA polymerase sigma factor n=1 Tax=Candidatus Tokpelaia hoelldobleri TaxID=1902579 RepID=A0A1U9JWZ7_9HYPH|nr:MAG: RNA polymerase sigma factor [Candidatus Tokpelaia hoelldoblerii]